MTTTAHVNGIDICFDAFGSPDDRCLLLISGFGQQLIDWEQDFIDSLVNQGLFVVVFDNRDAGLSSHMHDFALPDLQAAIKGDWHSAGYSLNDMAVDAIGLLDYLEIESAMIFGVSMGAMIAQCIAIAEPKRVTAMTLMSGSTGDTSVGQPIDEIKAAPFARQANMDPLDAAVASSSRWASFGMGVTDEQLRARLARRIERSHDPVASRRQLVAIASAPDRTVELQRVDIPTVVIHGTDDPMVDVSGGKATAAAIPGAELVLIEGLRHDIPRAVWPQVIGAITRVGGLG